MKECIQLFWDGSSMEGKDVLANSKEIVIFGAGKFGKIVYRNLKAFGLHNKVKFFAIIMKIS